MASANSSLTSKSESFLLEDLLEDYTNRAALERASQISKHVTSVTIGPNSSFRFEDSTEPREKITISVSCKTPENKSQPQRTVKITTSPITPSDLIALQQKLKQEANEKRLKEDVRKKIESRLEKEREHDQKIQKQLETMKLEAERKHREKVEALERQIEAALKLKDEEEQIYQKQRADLAKNSRKILEQQEKDLRDLRENLKRLDDHFGKLESTFNKISQSCNQEMTQLIEHKKQFDDIKSQRNSSRSSMEGMKRVCIKLEELCHSLVKANKDFEAQVKEKQAQKDAEAAALAIAAEAQAQAKAALEAAQKAAQPAPVKPPTLTQSASNEMARFYNDLMQLLNDKQNLTRDLAEKAELQSLRFALKMAVNKPINVLSETNPASLREAFQKVVDLLSGQPIETNQGHVSIGNHPQAIDWTKLRLAEKLVDICDKNVKTIFFVAALTIALWQKFPDFGQIFMAKLVKECPFLVPYKPQKLKGQSDEDFAASWGFRITETNEPYESYQQRTSNFAHLLSAIWITFPRKGETSPHPLNIANGWKYLINLVNSEPDPMYLHIIDKILEISGSTMHATYGKQFVKLTVVLRDHYLPSVEQKVDEKMKGAFDRLRDITIKSFFSENGFKPPKGKLNANFW